MWECLLCVCVCERKRFLSRCMCVHCSFMPSAMCDGDLHLNGRLLWSHGGAVSSPTKTDKLLSSTTLYVTQLWCELVWLHWAGCADETLQKSTITQLKIPSHNDGNAVRRCINDAHAQKHAELHTKTVIYESRTCGHMRRSQNQVHTWFTRAGPATLEI